MRLATIIAPLLLLLGCHHHSSTTPTPANETHDTAPAAVSAGIEMLESVDAAIADAGDCPARGAALQAWHDQNTTTITELSARLHAFPVDQIQAEVKAQMPDHQDAQALFEIAGECGEDPAFAAAWSSISAAFEATPD
jgi:hypothetical protein